MQHNYVPGWCILFLKTTTTKSILTTYVVRVAQSIERGTANMRVNGSNPN